MSESTGITVGLQSGIGKPLDMVTISASDRDQFRADYASYQQTSTPTEGTYGGVFIEFSDVVSII